MRNLEVYVNDEGTPQHLALRSDYSGSHGTTDLPCEYRSLCGSDTDNMRIQSSEPKETNLTCNTCLEQLKMWMEVHA
jgi:hypothetical protein